MKKLRRLPKNKIILWAVACALALLCVVCAVTRISLANRLDNQRAAERFRGGSETRFAQISAFFGTGKTESDIYAFRRTIDTALMTASLKEEEGKRLWQDAYSAESQVTVKGSKGSATAPTLGVGGDWFAFHNLKLRSGGYISGSDLMHDRVVLNETLAWKLFGGFDLEGMEVTIGGKPYIIAGVVTSEDDFASKKADSVGGRMFMSYDAMNALTKDGVKITSYELVCADPITGFAHDLVKKGFADAETVQNNGRFGFGNNLKLLKAFGSRSMVSKAVAYPYWENAARFMEDYTALLLILAFVFGAFPVVLVSAVVIKNLRRGWAWFKDWAYNTWERLSDNLRERQRLRLEAKSKANK
ncbi:MAG: ABC transporter permease [Oscillospiraceae bacterium]